MGLICFLLLIVKFPLNSSVEIENTLYKLNTMPEWPSTNAENILWLNKVCSVAWTESEFPNEILAFLLLCSLQGKSLSILA